MSVRGCNQCGYVHEMDMTSAVCPTSLELIKAQLAAVCPVPTQNNLTRPFTCPVCSGKGKVPAGFYGAIGVDSWAVSDLTPDQCRSCNETGVVWR